MAKTTDQLYNRFKPVKYSLIKNDEIVHLTITGQKLAPPSHRISLHQSDLKVYSAKITRFDKHGPIEIEVIRINHMPTIQQVRLHGGSVMYPGRYQIELNYKIKPDKLAVIGMLSPSRELLPSIDEDGAWQSAVVEIKP